MKIEIDNNYIQLDAVNLRQFRLHTDSEDVIMGYGVDNYITSVIVNDKFRIKVGEEYEVEGNKYKVNLIRKDDGYFYCIQERATKASQFIMPLLSVNDGTTYQHYDFKNTFYNCYISENYRYIYLVYKFSPTAEYLELESKLIKHSMFIELTDPDPNTVIVKFKLPEEFHKDVVKIMKGKYSEISPTMKSKICIFHSFNVKSKTYRMLHRDVELRKEMSLEFEYEIPIDIELMTKPELNKEIWSETSINKFQEVVNYD